MRLMEFFRLFFFTRFLLGFSVAGKWTFISQDKHFPPRPTTHSGGRGNGSLNYTYEWFKNIVSFENIVLYNVLSFFFYSLSVVCNNAAKACCRKIIFIVQIWVNTEYKIISVRVSCHISDRLFRVFAIITLWFLGGETIHGYLTTS